MNNEETAILTGLIRQIAPAQKIDAFTADVWAPLLAEVRMADAREALIVLGRTQSFISPADIIREVKRIRTDRVTSGPEFDPAAYPDGDTDEGYLAGIRDHTRRVADGEPPLPSPVKTVRPGDLEALIAPLLGKIVSPSDSEGDRTDMGR